MQRLRRLEQRLPEPEPVADLQEELACWRAFVKRFVLPAAAGHDAALRDLTAGLPGIEKNAFAGHGPVLPGEQGQASRRQRAFYELGMLLAPHPEVKAAVGRQIKRLIEQGQGIASKSA
jgi:hypothetical protein